ncbi:MAG: hypothetical protein ABR562_02515 [Thermoplasmatota archaeon]|nr:hypothetical protein [Halobacteriales archaeon]
MCLACAAAGDPTGGSAACGVGAGQAAAIGGGGAGATSSAFLARWVGVGTVVLAVAALALGQLLSR